MNRQFRFSLGRVVGTPGALDLLERLGGTPVSFLTRHAQGDWGDVSPESAKANDAAVEGGDRIMSVYRLGGGAEIWIVTEANRSTTTIMLPEDY